eukprot:3664222-Rhodomonas_salina.2
MGWVVPSRERSCMAMRYLRLACSWYHRAVCHFRDTVVCQRPVPRAGGDDGICSCPPHTGRAQRW